MLDRYNEETELDSARLEFPAQLALSKEPSDFDMAAIIPEDKMDWCFSAQGKQNNFLEAENIRLQEELVSVRRTLQETEARNMNVKNDNAKLRKDYDALQQQNQEMKDSYEHQLTVLDNLFDTKLKQMQKTIADQQEKIIEMEDDILELEQSNSKTKPKRESASESNVVSSDKIQGERKKFKITRMNEEPCAWRENRLIYRYNTSNSKQLRNKLYRYFKTHGVGTEEKEQYFYYKNFTLKDLRVSANEIGGLLEWKVRDKFKQTGRSPQEFPVFEGFCYALSAKISGTGHSLVYFTERLNDFEKETRLNYGIKIEHLRSGTQKNVEKEWLEFKCDNRNYTAHFLLWLKNRYLLLFHYDKFEIALKNANIKKLDENDFLSSDTPMEDDAISFSSNNNSERLTDRLRTIKENKKISTIEPLRLLGLYSAGGKKRKADSGNTDHSSHSMNKKQKN